jgi:putative transposase
MLERVDVFRGLPRVLSTHQRSELTGTAHDRWANRNRVTRRLIQAEKTTQNEYVESFTGR